MLENKWQRKGSAGKMPQKRQQAEARMYKDEDEGMRHEQRFQEIILHIFPLRDTNAREKRRRPAHKMVKVFDRVNAVSRLLLIQRYFIIIFVVTCVRLLLPFPFRLASSRRVLVSRFLLFIISSPFHGCRICFFFLPRHGPQRHRFDAILEHNLFSTLFSRCSCL